MPDLTFFILLIGGYCIGSIPFGYIISKMHGIDIRTVGSGNIGGTNVSRKLGVKWGALVGALDVFKSALVAYIGLQFLYEPWQLILVSLSPVVGHVFSVWMGFKGGKGVGATVGLLGVLFGLEFIVVWLILWITFLYLTKLMSLVNLVMVLILPVLFWIKYRDIAAVILSVVLCGIIWYAHRENVKRLLSGTELKLRW